MYIQVRVLIEHELLGSSKTQPKRREQTESAFASLSHVPLGQTHFAFVPKADLAVFEDLVRKLDRQSRLDF